MVNVRLKPPFIVRKMGHYVDFKDISQNVSIVQRMIVLYDICLVINFFQIEGKIERLVGWMC